MPKNKFRCRKRNSSKSMKIIKIDHFEPEKKIPGRKRKLKIQLKIVQNRPKSGHFGSKKPVFGPFWPKIRHFRSISSKPARSEASFSKPARNRPKASLLMPISCHLGLGFAKSFAFDAQPRGLEAKSFAFEASLPMPSAKSFAFDAFGRLFLSKSFAFEAR